jgi:hypothetical protein
MTVGRLTEERCCVCRLLRGQGRLVLWGRKRCPVGSRTQKAQRRGTAARALERHVAGGAERKQG